MSDDLKRQMDRVQFWEKKVARRFHKNAKKLATWNLWAAQEAMQHMAQAYQDGEVIETDDTPAINFPLPVWSGWTLHKEDDD